jgi:hypothetical protein
MGSLAKDKQRFTTQVFFFTTLVFFVLRPVAEHDLIG